MLEVANSTPSPLPKVGKLPDGWRRARLEDVANRASGHTPDQGKPEYWNGGIKWVFLADSGQLDRGYIGETDKEISVLGVQHSSAVLLPADTVVLSRDAGVGKSAILKREMAVSQHFIAWDCGPKGLIEPWFLYSWLQVQKPFFERMSVGSTIKTIGLPLFKRLTIDFPPLLEQRKIAEILLTWDEAIEKLEALRAANEDRYKVLARRFFPPCHPTFHGRPNAWGEFELGDVFRERSQSGEENDRLLSITMNAGVIDRADVGRKDTSTEDKSKYKLILPGDIGYNMMRMWQGVSGLSTLRGIISPAYTVVTPVPNRVVGRYAAHLFKSRRMVFDFERYSQGLTSDTWNLKFAAFSKIKVFVPPIEDQEKHADLLDTLTAESSVIEKQLEALTRQKRGLMQKLLTGEWRANVEAN